MLPLGEEKMEVEFMSWSRRRGPLDQFQNRGTVAERDSANMFLIKLKSNRIQRANFDPLL